MNGTALAELLEQVVEKVEKDVARVCIVLVKQYEMVMRLQKILLKNTE